MFSILLVLFAIVGLSLLFFLFLLLISSPKKGVFYSDDDQAVEIVKVVEAHRKIIPICSAQGWGLISSYAGLRCWKKELSFIVMGSPVTVYGCMKQINCSAVIVLNVIADIATWPEWDFWPEGQTMHLEVSEDPSLHGDRYMQCDQIVITSTVQAKSDVIMYRFGNLEQNGVGWILLWNAKRLDWTFYVAQPIDSSLGNGEGGGSNSERCTLTTISGFDASVTDSKTVPDRLCTKVLNLCEAISNSHIRVRPLQPLMKSSSVTLNNPHFPMIHTALSDLPVKPCVLLRLQKSRQLNILQNCVLAVRPVPSNKSGETFEFQLISRLLKETMNGSAINDALIFSEDGKRRSRRRQKIRSDSVASGSPVIKHLQIEGRRSSSLSAPPVRKKLPELTVTEPDDEPKLPTRAVSHSFLDLIFHRRRSSDNSDKRSRSPADSRCSTPPRERRHKKKDRSSSASSQEECSFISATMPSANRADVYIEDTLGLDDKEIDFKALGDKCIAALLRENVMASLIDIGASEEEQKISSGGWVLKEVSRDITIFKKTCLSRRGNVVSYLCKGLIPTSHKTIWKTLCNPLTRFMYDESVKKISVLSELPSGQKLIHMYNELVTLLRKEVQDFCLLQTEKEEENRLILAFHSVEDPLCPAMKDIIRGTVITSGWIVEKISDAPHAMVSYLIQMVVSNPDNQLMEEISNTQCQCIHNLSTYLLATKPTVLRFVCC